MTPEQQRMAIAEACGYEFKTHEGKFYCFFEKLDGWVYWKNIVPHYLNDLNAMHEAEKLLYQDPNSPKKYTQQIKAAICREAGVKKAKMDFDVCITATATQRAEAFLRTIGGWIE